MEKKKQWGDIGYDNLDDMGHFLSEPPIKKGQGVVDYSNTVVQPNAATEIKLQEEAFSFDYKTLWSESESRNYKLKMEIDDLKAQIDRLKAVLKDSL